MPTPMAADEVLDREFLTVRAKLIDIAAAMDRINRAEGSASEDPRLQKIQKSFEALAGDSPNRAEQMQLLFSIPYEENWLPE